MNIQKHYALTGEERFDARMTLQETMDGDRFRLQIQSGPRGAEDHGIPSDVIELVLSERQRARLHEALAPLALQGEEERDG